MRKFDERSAFESLAWLMRHARSESVRLAAHREYLRRTWGMPDEVAPEPEEARALGIVAPSMPSWACKRA